MGEGAEGKNGWGRLEGTVEAPQGAIGGGAGGDGRLRHTHSFFEVGAGPPAPKPLSSGVAGAGGKGWKTPRHTVQRVERKEPITSAKRTAPSF